MAQAPPFGASGPRRSKREPIALLVERRFPLVLSPSIASIRDLYNAAKSARWDPAISIPWHRFEANRYTAAQRDAARLCWSRRAWIEYGGLPETPALLVRFCLEEQRESDPKMFLTVRGTEIAWHTDCAYRLAQALGGYIDDPADSVVAALYNQNFHSAAFDATTTLDAYVAAHSAILDGIDLELYRESLRYTIDPLIAEMLRYFVADKERHVQFGWMYIEERAPRWDAAVRAQVVEEIEMIVALELAGYHCASLGNGKAFDAYVQANDIACEAGLGGITAAQERAVFLRYLAEARARLAPLGISFTPLARLPPN